MINMYVSQNKDVAYRIIDGEAVMLTPDNGMLHTLNPVATRVFELANGKMDVAGIIKVICEEFEVKESIATRDVPDVVEDLVHRKILHISKEPVKDKK